MGGHSGYNLLYIAEDDVAKTAFRCPGAIVPIVGWSCPKVPKEAGKVLYYITKGRRLCFMLIKILEVTNKEKGYVIFNIKETKVLRVPSEEEERARKVRKGSQRKRSERGKRGRAPEEERARKVIKKVIQRSERTERKNIRSKNLELHILPTGIPD